MNIAIIGAGNVGGTLARRFAALGHQVRVANSHGPQSLTDLQAETGVRPVSLDEIAAGADALFVAIPLGGIPHLPEGLLADLPHDSAVVDTGNYVPHLRDPRIDVLEDGGVESRWTESHLQRPLVKAFNTIIAGHLRTLGRPAGAPDRIALPVAGDDPQTKAVVIDLADQLGFDGIDAGGLDDSWRQQPGTPVYTTDLDAEHARKALARAEPQDTTAWRQRLQVPRA
ncbi:NAD(P)-binding domain-containing protein [Streptomyces spinosirectus]|nr:NAD(P)-binding domain-containing protein [Streptomyces spinosirectus]